MFIIQDVFVGLLLLLLLQEATAIATTDDYYYCYYFASNTLINLPRNPSPGNCTSQFLCWESQLTDTNRVNLLDMFNKYKTKVASGTCPHCENNTYRNVFKLVYNWFMEYLSLQITHRYGCPLSAFVEFYDVVRENIYYCRDCFNYGTFIYQDYQMFLYVSSSFQLVKGEDRDTAINKIQKILDTPATESKFLFQWTLKRYGFGGADVFGCSITLRDGVTAVTSLGEKVNNGRVAYFACVFATKASLMESGVGVNNLTSCRNYHHSAGYDPDEMLCYYPLDENKRRWDMPCQLYYHITESSFARCLEDIPHNWLTLRAPKETFTGVIIQFSASSSINLSYLLPATLPHYPPRTTTIYHKGFSSAFISTKSYKSVMVFYSFLTLIRLTLLE